MRAAIWASTNLADHDTISASTSCGSWKSSTPYSSRSGSNRQDVPLIVAGGINSHEAVRTLLNAGANGVQLGTPFAVTEEGDAHPNFKRVLAEATPEDIVEFVSVTGLPARAVKTPWLMRYLRHETRIRDESRRAQTRRVRPRSSV